MSEKFSSKKKIHKLTNKQKTYLKIPKEKLSTNNSKHKQIPDTTDRIR